MYRLPHSSCATYLSGAKLIMQGFARFTGIFLLLSILSPVAAFATTYYLAPAGNGGSDYHNGLSYGSPWLTPKHNLNCGDVILAQPSSSYDSNNFNSGHWGNVSCPNANNVAWLQCETFDACKIWSSNEGINVDHSFWGVQGWEVTVASGTNGFCFGAAPSSANWTNIHHIIFANNVANKCQAGGFMTYASGHTGVDYITIIGNIAYDAIQGGKQCYNAISIYEPVQSDWNSGTHIYVADNIVWGNFQPYLCGGVRAWGGDGIIFDTFDGSQSGLPSPYGAQAVAQNNIVISNGGHGLEVQNNKKGSYHSLIVLAYNTSWNNEINYKMQSEALCSEVLLNSAYNVHEAYNLVSTSSARQCVNDPIYALSAYDVDGTVKSYGNFAYGYNGQNAFKYAAGTFSYNSNTLGQWPYLHNAYTPGAPYCSGTGTVSNCMGWLMSNFTASATAAKYVGHQWPGTKPYDPLFPRWVCNVTLPAGLIAKGC